MPVAARLLVIVPSAAVLLNLHMDAGYIHSIHADGCFKLPHLRTAGAATTHEPALQRLFVPDAEVLAFGERTGRAPPASGQECNDFNADRVLGRRHQKYDLTGARSVPGGAMLLSCSCVNQS